MRLPLVVSYGVGRDSTALLIEMHRRNLRPDAILFANVGSEKRETYRYLPVINRWLREHDFPGVTVVRYRPRQAPYRSLEGNMVRNATLPGATFNRGSCTMKFKVEPQARWTQGWAPARQAWAQGQKVVKLIGFECDEEHRLRRADARAHAGRADPLERQRFEFRYPLMEWGMDLARCCETIVSAGLPVPVKSACFFCPNQHPQEVRALSPDDRARIILMELVAEPYNRKVRGLWRRPRRRDGRPGSITEFVLRERLPFTPLTALGRRIVLNPRCQKVASHDGAFTFAGPHVGPTLREQLLAAGHAVPEVVLQAANAIEADAGGAADAWDEDCREPDDSPCDRCAGHGDDDMAIASAAPASDIETDRHMELVEAL